jgi:hypothetical protein
LKDFSNGIFCLDLLYRILILTDLQKNPKKFGFVKKSDSWHVKIIDFRVTTDKSNFQINEEYFKGFLEGNTQFGYWDKHVKNIFKKHKKDLEDITREIFLNQFKNFNLIVEESVQDVLRDIKYNVPEKISETDLRNMEETLSLYKKAIYYNFSVFCKQLKIT